MSDEAVRSSTPAAFKNLRTNPEMAAERQKTAAYVHASPDKILAFVAEMDSVGHVMQSQEHGHGQPSPAHGHEAHDGQGETTPAGVEWEDLMPEVNRMSTPVNMRWKIVDRETGMENAEIDWRFRTGDQVMILLVNEMASDHPMHHPFHIHGERFLVLSRDGVEEANLVWKDTVLVTNGQTVDILMDGSNPGLWMAHCHIAEHNEGGMMFHCRVDQPE